MLDEKKIKQYLDTKGIPYEHNIDLKKKTWIHRGGKCTFFISPSCKQQLIDIAQYLYIHCIKFIVVGHTSNIYIKNNCNLLVVISTKYYNKFEIIDDKIVCDSGAGVIRLAKTMVSQGIKGFEYLTDLPGTVGGAIYNNSSCYSNSISCILDNVEILLPTGEVQCWSKFDFQFEYRSSVLKKGLSNGVILNATLNITRDDPKKLQRLAEINRAQRRQLLEDYSKTLGSTMNRCFHDGRMPLRYYFLWRLFNLILKFIVKNDMQRKNLSKKFICFISGYRKISRYISDEDVIIFKWSDPAADNAFPLYVEFMRKVYKTRFLEIEVLE